MKKIGILLITFVIFLIFLPGKVFAVNLIQNGEFESGTLEPWITSGGGATALISSEINYDGDYSLKVNNDKTGSYGYQQTIKNIEGNKYYLISGYGLTDNSNTSAYFLRIAWYKSDDGSGEQMADPNDSNRGEQINEWVKLEIRMQAPGEARSAKTRIVLNSKTENNLASVYFDNISFEESTTPTSIPTSTSAPTPTSVVVSTTVPTSTPTPIPTSTPTPTKKTTPTTTSTPTPEISPAEDILLASNYLPSPTVSNEEGQVLGVETDDQVNKMKLPIIFISLGLFLILVSVGTLLFPKLRGYKLNKPEN